MERNTEFNDSTLGFPTRTRNTRARVREVYEATNTLGAPPFDQILLAIQTPLADAIAITFAGPHFGEPTLIKLASAYEASTKHRTPPPDFGPLP